MSTLDMTGTKLKIFETAADLFARKGYHAVSMREIAEPLGLKAASIYNHFASKEGILHAIYDYFDTNMQATFPDLEELMRLAETAPPRDVLRRLNTVFPEEILDLMAQSMLVTSAMARYDTVAEELVFRNLVEMTGRYDRPLLEKMISLGRIEPVDIDSFVLVHSSYHHSSANRFLSSADRTLNVPIWLEGLDLIYSLIRIKE